MTVIVLTSGTSWTVPGDWSSTNTIEVWGGGAGGSSDNFTSTVSSGGGGGAYNIATNVTGLSGSIQIQIGAAGAGETGSAAATPGGSTWFNGTALATATVGAVGGSIATGSAAGGAGGLASACHPTTFAISGGTGGKGQAAGSGAGGGGAGGAAGIGGAGAVATTGTGNGGAGGQGANGTGGAGGLGGTSGVGGAGGANQLGGGGGGGAKGTSGASTGGAGGLPGGGGGGGSTDGSASLGGAGAGGQIVITYTPSGGGFTWSELTDPATRPAVQQTPQQPVGVASAAPYVVPPNIPAAWIPTTSFQNPSLKAQLQNAVAQPIAPVILSVLPLGWRNDANYQIAPKAAQNFGGNNFVYAPLVLGWRNDANYQINPLPPPNRDGIVTPINPASITPFGWRNDTNYQTAPKRAQNFGGNSFVSVVTAAAFTTFGWRNDANYQIPPMRAQQTGYLAVPIAPVIIILPSAPWTPPFTPAAPLRANSFALGELREKQASLTQVRMSYYQLGYLRETAAELDQIRQATPVLQQLRKTPPTLT